MAYEKQGFERGQVLTADCLNHMEDGIFAAEEKAARVEEEIEVIPEVLGENGIIKREMLPDGFPYTAEFETIIDRADLSAMGDKTYLSIPISRPLQIGEVCRVICETPEKTYAFDATVINASANEASPVISIYLRYGNQGAEDYIYFGVINFSSGARATYNSGTVVPSFLTVTVPGEVTKIDKKYLPEDIEAKSVILPSSTSGSAKRFKITVDDTGTLTAI